MNIETKDLRSFLVLAEEENFSRAASRLNIAQPALSLRIRDLEEKLGTRLLDRTTRQVKLNAAGEVFAAEARKILLSLSQAVVATQSAGRGESGTLRIGYTKRASYFLLPSFLRRLSAEYPKLRLDIHNPLTTGYLYAGVLDGSLDIALSYFRERQDKQLACESFTQSELVLVMPSTHPLAASRDVDLRQCAAERFVAYPSTGGFYLRTIMERLCQNAGFRPFVTNESSDTEALLCLVATGRYLAILPREMEGLESEGIVYRNIKTGNAIVQHGALWLKTSENLAVPLALSILREASRPSQRDAAAAMPDHAG